MICYNYINDYLKDLLTQENKLLKDLREYAANEHVPIIDFEVEKFLLCIGNLSKPKRILEIGTAIGYSAIVLSNMLDEDGRIDTIERSDKMLQLALENIKKAGLTEKINIIHGEAIEILSFLDLKYDMVFLDGAKGQYKEFLPHCTRLLNKGGLLISDNVLYKGMVANDKIVVKRKRTIVRNLREYLHQISNSKHYNTSILPLGDGLAISYKL